MALESGGRLAFDAAYSMSIIRAFLLRTYKQTDCRRRQTIRGARAAPLAKVIPAMRLTLSGRLVNCAS